MSIKYTRKWFKLASDEVLSREREAHRIPAFRDGNSYSMSVIERIDKEMSQRYKEKHSNEHIETKTRHREHGWYLPNDD